MRKIKHWQGYGSIMAEKRSRKVKGDYIILDIRVKGNHEYGIHTDDKYHIVRWLGKYFKDLQDERRICNLVIRDSIDTDTHEDICDYHIVYSTTQEGVYNYYDGLVGV
jgi:hypothetical protein